MKNSLVFTLAVVALFSSTAVSLAVTGIDEVTSLRSKLHATVEHVTSDAVTEEDQAHWLVINQTPWKWDESALELSASIVNTNYQQTNANHGDGHDGEGHGEGHVDGHGDGHGDRASIDFDF